MRFNPCTSELFTNDGQLIKRLHCPYRIQWEQLGKGPDEQQRQCSQCNHSILDTSYYSEEQLLSIIAANPSTCLQVNIQHPEIRLTHE
jgi:hypothetical protein